MNLPAKSELPGATTRFEDFQASHKQDTNTTYGDIIHYTVRSSRNLARITFLTHRTAPVPGMAQIPNARTRNHFKRRMQLHRRSALVGRSPGCRIRQLLPVRHVVRPVLRWKRQRRRQLRHHGTFRKPNRACRTAGTDNRLLLCP